VGGRGSIVGPKCGKYEITAGSQSAREEACVAGVVEEGLSSQGNVASPIVGPKHYPVWVVVVGLILDVNGGSISPALARPFLFHSQACKIRLRNFHQQILQGSSHLLGPVQAKLEVLAASGISDQPEITDAFRITPLYFPPEWGRHSGNHLIEKTVTVDIGRQNRVRKKPEDMRAVKHRAGPRPLGAHG
jgi:hypothetical protein